ncbi:hypothetical protein [Devosia sp. A449]
MTETRLAAAPRQEAAGNRDGVAHVGPDIAKERVMKTYDPHRSTTDVRQGNARRMNLRVLVLSTLGIVVLFAIIYLIYTLTQSNPS